MKLTASTDTYRWMTDGKVLIVKDIRKQDIEGLVGTPQHWADADIVITERGELLKSRQTACPLLVENIDIYRSVQDELQRATDKFGPFHSKHEGIAIIREEYLELEKEIFTNGEKACILSEAIQLAAMAVRLIKDCLPGMVTPNDNGTPSSLQGSS